MTIPVRDPFRILRQRSPVEREDSVVCINGDFVPARDAAISVFDHVLHYGDGVFETVAERNGYLFMLEQHMQRLYSSARAIRLDIPLTPEEFAQLIIESVHRNAFRESYTKVIVSRGESPEPLVEHRNLRVNVVIIPRKPFFKWHEEGQRGLRVKIASLRKTPYVSLDPRIKSLNYLNNILARIEAIDAGFDEALLLDTFGRVSEGSVYNVFLVRDGRMWQPPEGYLEGITRLAIMELAVERGSPVTDRVLYPYDLYNADEIFFCNTSRGIVPVVEVDGRVIADGKPGPLTIQLRDVYLERVNSGWYGTPALG